MAGQIRVGSPILQQDVDDSMRLVSLPIVLWGVGRHVESDAALSEQIQHWATLVQISLHGYAYRGDLDLALAENIHTERSRSVRNVRESEFRQPSR